MRELIFAVLAILSVTVFFAYLYFCWGSLLNSVRYNQQMDEICSGKSKKYFTIYFAATLIGGFAFCWGGINLFLFWLPEAWFPDGAFETVKAGITTGGAIFLMLVFHDGIFRTGITVAVLEKNNAELEKNNADLKLNLSLSEFELRDLKLWGSPEEQRERQNANQLERHQRRFKITKAGTIDKTRKTMMTRFKWICTDEIASELLKAGWEITAGADFLREDYSKPNSLYIRTPELHYAEYRMHLTLVVLRNKEVNSFNISVVDNETNELVLNFKGNENKDEYESYEYIEIAEELVKALQEIEA